MEGTGPGPKRQKDSPSVEKRSVLRWTLCRAFPGGMACVDQESCPPLEDRLLNTDFVANLWEWGNAATAAFAVICFFLAKHLYSLPHILQDSLDGRRRREARYVQRTIRKYQRLQRHQDRAGSGTFATSVAATRLLRGLGRHASKVSVVPDSEADGGTAAAQPSAAPPPATDAAYAAAADAIPAAAAPASKVESEDVVGRAATSGEGEQGAAADAASSGTPPPELERGTASAPAPAGSFVSLNVQLVLNDNPAVALSYTGYLVAYGLVLSGPRTPAVPGGDTLEDAIELAQWTATGILLLSLSALVTDKLLLRSFAMRSNLLTANAAAGIVEFGSHVSCGLVVRAVLSGYEVDIAIAAAYASTALFWALGQVAFFLTTAVLNWMTPYSVGQEIKGGNAAVAIQFASNQIASALRAWPIRTGLCSLLAASPPPPPPLRSDHHAAAAHRVAGRVRRLLWHRQPPPARRAPAAVPRAHPAPARPHGGQGGGGGQKLVRPYGPWS